jgi:hypothetical protein
MTIRPELDIIDIITNNTQKIGERSMISGGTPVLVGVDPGTLDSELVGGRFIPCAARSPIAPKIRPKVISVDCGPTAAKLREIGNVVRIAPIP